MNEIQEKDNGLKEYLECVKTSFKCNNYVFRVKSKITKDGKLEKIMAYTSDKGFHQNQDNRPGRILSTSGITSACGINEYVNTLFSAYSSIDADFIRTELCDNPNTDSLVLDYNKYKVRT